MPKEIYQTTEGDRTVTIEWERELVTVPVALRRGQFVPPLDPAEGPGKKFCEAQFIFMGVNHLETVHGDSDEDPCDKVKKWLKGLKNIKFTGERLSRIRLGELISREE